MMVMDDVPDTYEMKENSLMKRGELIRQLVAGGMRIISSWFKT